MLVYYSAGFLFSCLSRTTWIRSLVGESPNTKSEITKHWSWQATWFKIPRHAVTCTYKNVGIRSDFEASLAPVSVQYLYTAILCARSTVVQQNTPRAATLPCLCYRRYRRSISAKLALTKDTVHSRHSFVCCTKVQYLVISSRPGDWLCLTTTQTDCSLGLL